MKRPLKWIVLLSLASLTLMAFQNCGAFKGSENSNEVLSSLDKSDPFFAYPYGSAPEFYVDAFIFRPAASSSLAEFKFLGVVARPAGAGEDINYIVTFKDDDGTTICPSLTGTLQGGASNIISDCVSARVPTSLLVKVVVSSMGQQFVLERVY